MYIENLRIEHFGQLSDVCADGLHRQLSILWCSGDSERDDARDFLRWLLFGATEASRRKSSGPTGGFSRSDFHRSTSTSLQA